MKKWEISEGRQKASGHDNALAPDPIRKPTKKDEERRADKERNDNKGVGRSEIFQAQGVLEKEQGVKLSGIPDDALPGGRAEQGQPNVLGVRVGEEAVAQRCFRTFALSLHFREDGRLLKFQPNVNRDRQQNYGEEKRN